MRRKYVQCVVTLLLALLCCGTCVSAAPESKSATAVHNLNALSDEIDYKVNDDIFQNLRMSLVEGYDVDESEDFLVNDVKQNMSSVQELNSPYLVAAMSYLIKEGILERPVNIVWDNNKYKVSYNSTWFDTDNELLRSDLYVMLYRTRFGSLPGRSLVLNNEAVRDGKSVTTVKNAEQTLDYSEGDFYCLFQDDTYELYLESLLDKGILLKSELDSANSFVEEYDNNSVTNRPPWSASRGLATSNDENALGQTYTIEGENVLRTAPTFFGEAEQLTVIDALKIVEKFLRLTEKDMTRAEADIIMYKYGISYLSGLGDDEADTVAFLVAKGVLSFEEDAPNFFRSVTYGDILPILYRVANVDARYNFSEVQLTDAEAFWQQEGFSQEDFELEFTSEPFVMETVSVTESKSVSWLNRFFANAEGSLKDYIVVKDFDRINAFYWDNVPLEDIIDMSEDERKEEYPMITKVESANANGVDVNRITFNVTASSMVRATQIVDSHISYRVIDAQQYKVSAVTKIENDGTEVRMIAQDALRKCFPSIDVVEDKVLRNSNNGAMACLLQDSGYALVGNQIYANRYILVVDASNTVYYNLDVISGLVGAEIINVYSDSVDTKKVAKILKAKSVDVKDAHDANLGEIEYIVADTASGELNLIYDENDSAMEPAYLYNVNQLTSGISTLVRSFTVNTDNDEKKEKMTVVVDWVYAVPSLSEFNAEKWLNTTVRNTSLTLHDIYKALYTEPSNGDLRDWWNSNIGMSNALANFMFGTSHVEYVKCGYLVPKLHILLSDDTDPDCAKLANISKVFIDNGFVIPDTYSKWVGGSTKNFLGSYFTNVAGFKAGSPSYLFAQKNRYCKIYEGGKESNGGKIFGKDFYMHASGALYRTLGSDSTRLTYTTDDEAQKITSLVIHSSTKGAKLAPDGTIFQHKGQSWYYHGVETLGDETYLKMTLLNASLGPTFKVDCSRDPYQVQLNGEYSSLKNCVETLYTDWFSRSLSDIRNDDNLQDTVFKQISLYTFTLDGIPEYNIRHDCDYGIYLNEEEGVYYYDTSGLYPTDRFARRADNRVYSDVHVLPTIYQPAGSFYVYYDDLRKDYYLGEGALENALNTGDIYCSSIIGGIINSILASSVNTVEIKSLPDGTKLQVGVYTLTKSGNYWLTKPIASSEIATLAKKSKFKQAAYKLWTGESITCDGITVPLSNYVKSATLRTDGLTNDAKKDGCVMFDKSGNVRVYKGKSYKDTNTSAKYSLLKINLDGTLLARKLKSDGSLYGVCGSASESIVAGTKYPFFTEGVSFESDSDDTVLLSQSSFEMTAAYNARKDQFNLVYKKKWYEDFWTLLKVIIICASSYLSIISWATYMMISRGTLVRFFEIIAGKRRDGSASGVDIIKLLSFGVYSLDDPPQLSRTMIVTFVCILLAAICLEIL